MGKEYSQQQKTGFSLEYLADEILVTIFEYVFLDGKSVIIYPRLTTTSKRLRGPIEESGKKQFQTIFCQSLARYGWNLANRVLLSSTNL